MSKFFNVDEVMFKDKRADVQLQETTINVTGNETKVVSANANEGFSKVTVVSTAPELSTVTITENKTITAGQGDYENVNGWSSVAVNVPVPNNYIYNFEATISGNQITNYSDIKAKTESVLLNAEGIGVYAPIIIEPGLEPETFNGVGYANYISEDVQIGDEVNVSIDREGRISITAKTDEQ